MRRTKRIFTIISLVIAVYVLPSRGDYRDASKAVKVSGGEDHTLVLTSNKWAWACGANEGVHIGVGEYWGVLGTGETEEGYHETSLVRVHGVNDVDYLEDICDIDAGWKHSLALDVNGFVWSWGWNSQGQLGDGFTYTRTTPVQVKSGEQDPDSQTTYLRYIRCISAGRSGEHSLAADANGYAYAWGRNGEGQLGYGVTGSYKTTPVDVNDVNDVGPLEGIISVSAGERHSMALEDDDPCHPTLTLTGRVYTWGDNDFVVADGNGVLGIGDGVGDRNTPVCVLRGEQDVNEPNQIYLKYIVGISAGWDHSMALEKDDPWEPNLNGRVYTWGNNDQGWGDDGNYYKSNGGRLGNGSATDGNSTPVLVLGGEQDADDPNDPYPYLSHITAVSAGEAHSMALDVNGYVYTWGDNQHGQLGDGTDEQRLAPVRVVGQDRNRNGIHDANEGYLENIVAISAGYWHSLAIDADGVIWTWGKGSDGQLGLANKTIDCNTPHPIPVVYNETQETFAFLMEQAIEDANDDDFLVGTWGVYYENVDFNDKTITLESEDPNDPDVVAATIINGQYNTIGTYFEKCAVHFGSDSGSRLAGFTVAEAVTGGIACVDLSSAHISKCVIRDNGWEGIYLDASSVNITACEIRDNGSKGHDDYHGIYCDPASEVNISNCLITDNDADGIYCNQSLAAIMTSVFSNNGCYGIYVDNSSLDITSCIIQGNGSSSSADFCGLYCDDAATTAISITNNWICGNGSGRSGSGIYLNSGYLAELEAVVIRHNTIANNAGYGISTPGIPDMNNCIIWGNDSGSLQYNDYTVTYSCVEGAPLYSGTGNINSDPCFFDADANDLHLDANSLCIDAGDPDFEADANETDIDGEERVINERVDMGADEFYWSEADYSGDGLVNFVDYALLTSYWQDSGIDYNKVFLDGDSNSVGLAEFCNEWLWEAGWLTGPMPLMAGRSGEGMAEGLRLQPAPYELAAAEEKPRIAEPVDVKQLLDWLAKIWLDPDVREAINPEDWLKLYKSVKDLE